MNTDDQPYDHKLRRIEAVVDAVSNWFTPPVALVLALLAACLLMFL